MASTLRFDTPREVAEILARHAPRKPQRILDPAVGTGALLVPIMNRGDVSPGSVCAIDIDANSLDLARSNVGPLVRSRAEFIHADFVTWALKAKRIRPRSFDCVIMNPPFCARNGHFRSLQGDSLIGIERSRSVKVSVEVAFILLAHRILRPGGRLLAVLPSSVMTSDGCAWLRKALLENGSVKYVHELPRFTFSNVESRMYLLIYDKRGRSSLIELRNHELHESDVLKLSRAKLNASSRLDFGFYRARMFYQRIQSIGFLDWRPLQDVADVIRGGEDRTPLWHSVVHLWSYRKGFWRAPQERATGGEQFRGDTVNRGDILVKRVGRNCIQSFGKVHGAIGFPCSDCVLIIRPHDLNNSIRLLFALRCIVGMSNGPAFLERGTGARYLTGTELRTMSIPLRLSQRYCRAYRKYETAVRKRDILEMCKIEKSIQQRLLTLATPE